MINDEIDKLRLATTSALLSGRQDVIVVSSVSSCTSIGQPGRLPRKRHHDKGRTENCAQPVSCATLYRHSIPGTIPNARGTFRVKGDTIDIRLAYEEIILRVVFWGDEIESITTLYAEDGVSLGSHDQFKLYPANIFVTLTGTPGISHRPNTARPRPRGRGF